MTYFLSFALASGRGVIGAHDVRVAHVNPALIRYRSDFLIKQYFVVYMYYIMVASHH